MPSYRYSRWDGTQEVVPFDPEELLEHLADDLLADGDLRSALQRLMQAGYRNRDGQRMLGLQQLLERLRQQRQRQLDRYQLNDLLKDIREKLDQVVRTEREGIQRRLERARQGQAPPQPGAPAAGQRPDSAPQPGAQPAGGERQRPPADAPPVPSPVQPGGAQEPGGERDAEGLSPEQLQRALEQLARRKQEFLDNLPKDVGGAIRALMDYEFMEPEAQRLFQELLEQLQQQIMESYFQGLKQSLQDLTQGPRRLTADDLRRLNAMLRDLNELLRQRQEGGEPDFERFMQQHGQFFPPGMQNLDDLVRHLQQRMAAVQSLLDSLSPAQRRELQQMLQSLFRDPALQEELTELALNLEQLYPMGQLRRQYPFRGDDPLSLQEAMRLMEQLQELDQLERQLLRARDPSALDQIDPERVRELLGDDAAQSLEQLRQLTRQLEEAGYIAKKGQRWELTPRAIRKIGQKALRDIFQHLRRDAFGRHETHFRGRGGERTDESKGYEFGDPFLLDLQRTVMNGVMRQGPGTPVRLQPQDFEVYRTELLTQCATVLLLDMSRSMFLRGCITAAKKVAIALHALIRGQYPRDGLYIVPFSYYAREIKPEDLPHLTWNEWGYGTNMQHAFMLARQLLARHKGGSRQIILITDGEPTAYFDGEHIEFSYPPTQRTFQETLREVARCTNEGIMINTFMLERGHYLIDFVDQLTKINRGRAFYATPERLGEYILVDYVDRKRKQIR